MTCGALEMRTTGTTTVSLACECTGRAVGIGEIGQYASIVREAILAPLLDLLVSQCSHTHPSRLCPRPYPVHPQVGEIVGWLQLRYAHIYDRTPLERAYARLLTRSTCHEMLE